MNGVGPRGGFAPWAVDRVACASSALDRAALPRAGTVAAASVGTGHEAAPITRYQRGSDAELVQPEGGARAAAGRLGEHAAQALGVQFARALDQRSGDEAPAPAVPPDAAAMPWCGLLPACLPPGLSAGAPLPPAPASAPADAAAAVHAAAAPGDAAPLLLAAAEPGAAWELSLNEPDGLQLALRAERQAGPAAGGLPAAWQLVVSASGADAAALQRHAPRLAERLFARGLAPAHLRIEPEHAAAQDTRRD